MQQQNIYTADDKLMISFDNFVHIACECTEITAVSVLEPTPRKRVCLSDHFKQRLLDHREFSTPLRGQGGYTPNFRTTPSPGIRLLIPP